MKFLLKYLPDAIFLIGVWITSYNILRPPIEMGSISISFTDYHTEWKVLGIILIVISINITVRRYFANKKKIQDS